MSNVAGQKGKTHLFIFFPRFPQSCLAPTYQLHPTWFDSGALLRGARVGASLPPGLFLSLGVPGDGGEGVSWGWGAAAAPLCSSAVLNANSLQEREALHPRS